MRRREIPRQIFWRKLWISFLLSSCSFCFSEGAAIGDIGGGDNNDLCLLASCRRSSVDAARLSEPSQDLLSDDWVATTTILSDRRLLTPSSLPSRASRLVPCWARSSQIRGRLPPESAP